ncbi:MAG: hypothetical protein AAGK78_16205, partial [Planctomycetota bacterium]
MSATRTIAAIRNTPARHGPRKRRSASLLVLTPIFAAGCMLGPTPERPEVDVPLNEPFAYATTQPGEQLETTNGWWDRFGDDTTSQLVRLALVRNADIRLASARVLERKALLNQATAGLLPSVTGNVSRDRRQTTINLPAAAVGGPGAG